MAEQTEATEQEPFVGFIVALAGGGNGAMAWHVRRMSDGMIALMQDNVALAAEALEAEALHRVRIAKLAAETEPEYRCEGCGKTSRIAMHRPGCSVAAAYDARQAGDRS